MSNKPFLGTKNEKGELVDCYCLECHLTWKRWLQMNSYHRFVECYEALAIPYDRLDLEDDPDEETNDYFSDYRCQRFAIDTIISDFLLEKPAADQLMISTYRALRFLKLEEEEDPRR